MNDAVYQMIEAAGRTAESFGVTRLLGQIYMFLYMHEDGCCLDELAEELGVSKASISIGCRQLQQRGLIRKIWVQGSRKDFYQAENDFGKILREDLLDTVNKKLESAEKQIALCLDMLKEDKRLTTEQKQSYIVKLDQAQRLRSRVAMLMNNPLIKKLI